MKLQDLEPEWILADYPNGRRIGLLFLCPCVNCNYGNGTTLGVLFANPIDGGAAHPDDDQMIGNNKGKRWTWAGGQTFDDLSVTPSIDATKDANGNLLPSNDQHWHGYITNGELTP